MRVGLKPRSAPGRACETNKEAQRERRRNEAGQRSIRFACRPLKALGRAEEAEAAMGQLTPDHSQGCGSLCAGRVELWEVTTVE